MLAGLPGLLGVPPLLFSAIAILLPILPRNQEAGGMFVGIASKAKNNASQPYQDLVRQAVAGAQAANTAAVKAIAAATSKPPDAGVANTGYQATYKATNAVAEFCIVLAAAMKSRDPQPLVEAAAHKLVYWAAETLYDALAAVNEKNTQRLDKSLNDTVDLVYAAEEQEERAALAAIAAAATAHTSLINAFTAISLAHKALAPACLPGHGVTDALTCEVCGRGYYSNQTETEVSTGCRQCPIGYTTTSEKATNCKSRCG
jgi:hypothetical protein